MRIAIVCVGDVFGGVERHAVALANAAQKRGHCVSLLAVDSSVFLHRVSPEIEIIRVKRDSAKQSIRLLPFARVLRRLRVDVCVFEKGGFFSFGALLEIAAKWSSAHFVTIEHMMGRELRPNPNLKVFGVVPRPSVSWYLKRLRTKLLSTVSDYKIAVSNAVRISLANCYGCDCAAVRVIHNGVDIARFQFDIEEAKRVRSEFGICERAFVFGSMGRLVEGKRIDIAISQVRRLKQEFTSRELKLMICGSGPERDGLKKMAMEMGVDEHIIFIPFVEDPWRVFCAIDCFLLPSATEGLPYSLLEAMACKCVPVAFSVGGVPEVVTNSSIGRLVPPGDEPRFGSAMLEIASLPQAKLKEMETNARNHVVRHFDERVRISQIVDVLEAQSYRGVCEAICASSSGVDM